MGERELMGIKRKSYPTEPLFACQCCICSKFLGVAFTTPKYRKKPRFPRKCSFCDEFSLYLNRPSLKTVVKILFFLLRPSILLHSAAMWPTGWSHSVENGINSFFHTISIGSIGLTNISACFVLFYKQITWVDRVTEQKSDWLKADHQYRRHV